MGYAMPSEKLTRILWAKSPFTPEQIASMSNAEGWDWVYSHANPRKQRLSTVCFTGFSQLEKDRLIGLATDARFQVVGSVNKSLAVLCAGDNAGPAKLAKAKKQGIAVLTRAEFMNFLETGEIPL
jgi:DNA ligase (NAD+)